MGIHVEASCGHMTIAFGKRAASLPCVTCQEAMVVSYPALVAALRTAEEALCRATFKGPPDRRGLKDAIQEVRQALKGVV